MADPRICIVGAGGLSSKRIYPYIGAAGAQLVGVCDLSRTRAEQNARRFGGAVYTDMAQMLDEQKPDGLIICIGPKAHASWRRLRCAREFRSIPRSRSLPRPLRRWP